MLEEKGGDLAEEVKRRVRSVVRVRKGIISEVRSVIGIRSNSKRVEIQIRNFARHVVTEIPRTEEAAAALEKVRYTTPKEIILKQKLSSTAVRRHCTDWYEI